MKRKILFLLILLMINSLCFFPSQIVNASPIYEDFTTYTEVEPDNRIQKTATHIDHLAKRDEDSYLYKDKGVDHFGNFEHLVDVKLVDSVEGGSLGCVWALTNDLDDMYALRIGGKTAVWVNTYYTIAWPCRIQLREEYGSSGYSDDSIELIINTMYYLKIAKSGISLTCTIYESAADRSNNVNIKDTLTLVLHADHSFRYVFGCNTFNSGDYAGLNNDIENLDLQEAFTVTFYNNTGGILKVNGTTISNETSKEYDLNEVIELGALPINSSYRFQNFTYYPTDQYFTTYQEVDPNEHIFKSANRVTFTELNRDEDAYVYKDYGISHFQDFTHDFDFRITNESDVSEGSQGICAGWLLSNDLDDINGLLNANNISIFITFDTLNIHDNNYVRLSELYNGIWYYDPTPKVFVMNTTYYVRVVKSGTSLIAGFYSSSVLRDAGDGEDGDIENLSLNLHNDHFFRYVGVSWSCDDNSPTLWLSGYVENLDLHFPNYSKTNPHNLTITSDLTLWCYFDKPSTFGIGLGSGFILAFILSMALIIGVVAISRRKS